MENEEDIPENPYRAKMLKELKNKVECIDCDPTKDELADYYRLKKNNDPVTKMPIYSNSWQNYYNTYFLYFPDNLKNPWYTPGSLGNVSGGRAPGFYYPPYAAIGQGGLRGRR